MVTCPDCHEVTDPTDPNGHRCAEVPRYDKPETAEEWELAGCRAIAIAEECFRRAREADPSRVIPDLDRRPTKKAPR